MFPPYWGKIMPLDLESGLTACSIMIRRTCLLVAEWGTRIERTYTWRSDFTYGSLGIKRIVRRPAVLYEATQYAADCSLRAVFPDGGHYSQKTYTHAAELGHFPPGVAAQRLRYNTIRCDRPMRI